MGEMTEKRGIVGFSHGRDVLAAIHDRLEQALERPARAFLMCDLPPALRHAPEHGVPRGGEALRAARLAQAIGGLARHPHFARRGDDRTRFGERAEERGLALRHPAVGAGPQRNGREGGNPAMIRAARLVRAPVLHPAG
jgi:hypothetical protein